MFVAGRIVVAIGCLHGVHAHGAGVWKDDDLYSTDSSVKGLRFTAEYPMHILNTVGTDDGKHWWASRGTCSGELMTNIHLARGDAETTDGKWTNSAEGSTILWPEPLAAWRSLDAPTPAIESLSDELYTHAGVFIDPEHHVPGTFAGLRIIAEDPPHVLKMVGSDDGKSFWFLQGSCYGPRMTSISFDFSPKGGPADLVGVWDGRTRTITWPDGNAWTKAEPATTAALAQDPAQFGSTGPLGGRFGGVALLGVLAVVGALAHKWNVSLKFAHRLL